MKPVERTYAKSRSKLDEYVYIESSKGLDDIEVSLGKKKEEASPVPKKRRKIETRSKPEVEETARELRSKESKGKGKKRSKKTETRPQKMEEPPLEPKRTRANKSTKESIENDKTSPVARVTRKRKHEEITKPVLREKGQNGHASRKNSLNERKVAKPRKAKAKPTLAPLTIDVEPNVRMTRSRQRRLEISLSPSQVKNFVPAFSFESDRRMTSVESNKSAPSQTKTAKKPKAPKKPVSKAKTAPVRATRNRANRR